MSVRILCGDVRERLAELPDESVHCVVTSPPYFNLRDYGIDGQIGLEGTPAAFVETMLEVFREVRRVLRNDGTLWLNLGDSYAANGMSGLHSQSATSTLGPAKNGLPGNRNWIVGAGRKTAVPDGLKPKDLIGIPWRVAFALQADGWYLRQDIIWSKPNPMPESVTDRCTKAHEYLFLLSKSARYHYDAEAIKETASENSHARRSDGMMTAKQASNADRNDGESLTLGRVFSDRNRRSVWTVATQPFSEAHFATFPPALIEPCILAGCPKGGTVLDPFGGAGTTGLVADRHGRDAILIELNPEYAEIARKRIHGDSILFADVTVQGLTAPAVRSEAKSPPSLRTMCRGPE